MVLCVCMCPAVSPNNLAGVPLSKQRLFVVVHKVRCSVGFDSARIAHTCRRP